MFYLWKGEGVKIFDKNIPFVFSETAIMKQQPPNLSKRTIQRYDFSFFEPVKWIKTFFWSNDWRRRAT